MLMSSHVLVSWRLAVGRDLDLDGVPVMVRSCYARPGSLRKFAQFAGRMGFVCSVCVSSKRIRNRIVAFLSG